MPPEVLFASRKINTSGNKAKDTRTSGNQGRISMIRTKKKREKENSFILIHGALVEEAGISVPKTA